MLQAGINSALAFDLFNLFSLFKNKTGHICNKKNSTP